MKCQEVKERLKKWGNALTKDIRKQRNEHALKCSHEVCILLAGYNAIYQNFVH